MGCQVSDNALAPLRGCEFSADVFAYRPIKSTSAVGLLGTLRLGGLNQGNDLSESFIERALRRGIVMPDTYPQRQGLR